uniref:IS66 family transposase n=1 Tax=Lachnospira eligens TaxID=39485 RepID=UPI003FF117E2
MPADKKCFTSKAVPKAAQKESLSYLVIKQIQAVYREEDKLKELKPEDRLRQRQVVIKPLIDALFAYLKSNERKVSTAKLKQAVTYAINQRFDKSRDI